MTTARAATAPLPHARASLPGSGRVETVTGPLYRADLHGSAVDTPGREGVTSLPHPTSPAAGQDTVLGLPTWLIAAAVVAVLVAVLAGRGGGKRKNGKSSGRSGRILGLPVLLVVGLLLGATAFGGHAVRTVVIALVHAITTLGGLFGS